METKQTRTLKKDLIIKAVPFYNHPDPKNATEFTMADYGIASVMSGYYPNFGVLRHMGYEYYFRKYLNRYWVRNGDIISEAFAKSPSDLKRVLRAQYIQVHRNFKAVLIT